MTGGQEQKRLAQRLREDSRRARARSARLRARSMELALALFAAEEQAAVGKSRLAEQDPRVAVARRAASGASAQHLARHRQWVKILSLAAVAAPVQTDHHAPSPGPGSQFGAAVTAPARTASEDASVMEDRTRIAADLHGKVISRVFAAGLTLQGTAALAAQPDVRRRIENVVYELDHVIREIRDAVFRFEHRPRSRPFRQEILAISSQRAAVPEVSFSGPIDTTLDPKTSTQLLEILRHALGLISEHTTPARIDATAGQSSYVIVVEAGPISRAAGSAASLLMLSRLRHKAAKAGIRLDIRAVANGSRFTWHVPITPGPYLGEGASRGPQQPHNHTSQADLCPHRPCRRRARLLSCPVGGSWTARPPASGPLLAGYPRSARAE